MEILAWRRVCQSWRSHPIVNLQSFFDHIYILNLDRRPDRWSMIQTQLEQARIKKAVRFSAIDKKPGWVGCFESHLVMLQYALAANAKNVLVLEDDATFYADWMGIWQEGIKQVEADWDMLYLGYNLDPENELHPELVASHLLRLNSVLTTHAYAVNGKYLADLVAYAESQIDSGLPIDVVFSKRLRHINAFGLYPMLFYQATGMSDILGRECVYHLRRTVEQALKA